MSYARIPTRNAQGVKRFTYPVRLGRVVERGPAEVEPMSAMHPVTLGVLLPRNDLGPVAGTQRLPISVAPTPIFGGSDSGPTWGGVFSAAGSVSMPPTPALNTQPATDIFVPPGTPAIPLAPSSPSAAAVAAQTTITPLVSTPATQPPPYVLITQQPGQAPGITISNAPGQLSVFDQISTWFTGDTLIAGVQNMWLVGGAIVIWLMLQGRRR